MLKRFKSCAEWPEDVYTASDGTHISTDKHHCESAALSVCNLLHTEGFGGWRKDFPVRTWVEPIEGEE